MGGLSRWLLVVAASLPVWLGAHDGAARSRCTILYNLTRLACDSVEKLPGIVATLKGEAGKLTDKQQETITDLGEELSSTPERVETVLRGLGERKVPPEEMGGKLVEGIEHFKRLSLVIVASTLQRGQAAVVGETERVAVGDFIDNGCDLPEGERRGPGKLKATADRLLRLGSDDNTKALEQAIQCYRALLRFRSREREPDAWAQTQFDLGKTLLMLGMREGGTARYEEAVTVLRAILTEWTQARKPLNWAVTQTNLGTALLGLGFLEEAVAAYRAALSERTREREPLDWALIQNNLGLVFAALGERESGTARLEAAVAALRAALGVRTRELVPLDWARSQANLGMALKALGEREGGTARFEEALRAEREAWAVYRDAGFAHFRENFEPRILALEAALAAAPKGQAP